MARSMPTKEEFKLTERPYVWLRDLSRAVSQLYEDRPESLEGFFSSIRQSTRSLGNRLSILESETFFTKNTDINIFGSLESGDEVVDITIDEVDQNRYNLIIFVIIGNAKTRQPYVACDFLNGNTIRIYKSPSIGEIDYKIILREVE